MDVCYDAERMTLRRDQLSTTLGSNESDMLLALIEGITDKEALISRVWGGRGLIVSDSSYYKTVHALRSKLLEVGLSRDTLKTLPKRGLVLYCEIAVISTEAAVESESPFHPEVEHVWAEASVKISEDAAGIQTKQNDLNAPASSEAYPAEDERYSAGPSAVMRDGLIRRNTHLLLPGLVFLGALLPVIYAYLMFHKPPDLEAWKRVWEGAGATLYAEQSESMSKDDVLNAMAGFEPSLVLKDTNYYVRKPLSQLLVSCVRPESHGEALCVNYLRVGKK